MKYLFFKDKKKISYGFILFLFSILINQYYGYIGINPIDSFFTFNSGYDILKGYFPFKDYWTITGLFTALTQAFFFKIFGVSWSSYVFHASVFNLIFSLTFFYTLNKFKLDVKYAFLYSIFLSILASPSSGTPYVDHQSSYLSIIALFFFILGIYTNSKVYWFILPITLALSFLTKQAPAGHIFLLISLLSLIYFIYNFHIKKILFGILGSFLIVVLFIIFLFIAEISFLSFLQQYIFFPLSLGESRLDFLFPLEFNRIILRYKLIHLSSLLLLVLLIKKIIFNYRYIKDSESLILISLIGASYILIMHQLMTINGIYIYFLIPVLGAFSHIYFLKYFSDKKYILYLLIALIVGSTFYYGFNYIHKRDFMDLKNVDIKKSVNANTLSKKLNGLRWITPIYPKDPEKEIIKLKEAINIIKQDNRKKTIVTDYQVISVVLDQYDYSPSQVWFGFHVNPEKNSIFFKIYKNFFINKLKENKIEVVYVVKPMWGGNDIFERPLNIDCFKKDSLNEILDLYLLLECKDLRNK